MESQFVGEHAASEEVGELERQGGSVAVLPGHQVVHLCGGEMLHIVLYVSLGVVLRIVCFIGCCIAYCMFHWVLYCVLYVSLGVVLRIVCFIGCCIAYCMFHWLYVVFYVSFGVHCNVFPIGCILHCIVHATLHTNDCTEKIVYGPRHGC